MKEQFTVVTRKGQITVPVEIRKGLGLKEGDRVAVVLDDQVAHLRKSGSVVERTAGALRSQRPALSPEQELEEFEQGIAEEVTGTLKP